VTDARPIAWPTAREIAVAIVTAARLHDEDPILTVEGATVRGRWLALAALLEVFPRVVATRLAILCGNPKASGHTRQAIREKRVRGSWWRDADLETVKAALNAAINATEAEAAIQNRAAAPAAPPADEDIPFSDLLVVPVPKIFDRTVGAANPDISALPPLRLTNITDDELRGLHPQIVEKLGPEQKAISRSAPTEPRHIEPSPAARALDDFQRSRHERKTEFSHSSLPATPLEERIVDARNKRLPVNLTALLMGDPPKQRSALEQRNAEKQS
jgi:hypothetical protein